ncbi:MULTISPECIES: heavy metal translocating P-type ATPase [Calditerrivibrio]|uniref:heavy metal translocating P-type ATPase n=2 Tax=Calditerrivibrionaceae TaxID=2945021 RepID=UPI003C756FC0
MKNVKLSISGMTCAACSGRIEKKLKRTDGVLNVSVNLPLQTGEVVFDETKIQLDKIIKIIEDLGYGAKLFNKNLNEESFEKWILIKIIVGFIFSTPLFLGMIFHLLHISSAEFLMNPYVQLILATPVQFYCGFQFYKGAYHNLKTGGANMDLLVALGTSTAYIFSVFNIFKGGDLYFETSAILITLVLFGKYMEAKATGKASDAIKKLIDYAPKKAKVIKDGIIYEIDIKDIKVGDLLLVGSGDKVPVDGEIVEGKGLIDESMITGESLPIDKTVGDRVIGGTINKHYIFKMIASTTSEGTILSQIIRLIENVQTSKAPIQRFADKVSNIFVPSVVGVSILTFLGWYTYSHNLSTALINAVAVLVISCPCALGLATPTSIMVSSGVSAKKGILFKDAAAIENINKIKAIIFDKTGTITTGKIYVKKFQSTGVLDENLLFSLVKKVESHSSHPLASAIVEYISNKSSLLMDDIDVLDIEEKSGSGMRGYWFGKELFVGKPYTPIEEEPGSIVAIYIEGRLEGYFLLQDQLKDDAADVVGRFMKDGVEVFLLTGDNRKTADFFAEKIGLDRNNVISEVLPSEKAEYVSKIREKKEFVAMVGDGINDAPALATADIAIAMGNGTDIAIESASVVVMRGDLGAVYNAFKIGEYTLKNIKQNLFWALFYNSLGIPLAAFGFLNPIIAGTAMAFSSVSVVSNALRLRKMKLIY